MKPGKSAIVAIIGCLAVITAILLNFPYEKPKTSSVEKKTTEKKTPIKLKSNLADSDKTNDKKKLIVRPSFDTVLTTAQGGAVIAGRALPQSTIKIFEQGEEIGKVIANNRGEWLFQPLKPLKSGNRALSLLMIDPNGEITKSNSDLIIVVPEKGKNIAGSKTETPSKALAIKIPKTTGGKLEVLQKPNADIDTPIIIDTVDYNENGKLDISGKSSNRGYINLYINNKFIGEATPNKVGSWRFLPNKPVRPGTYKLRADHISENGRVSARIEVTFTRSTPLKHMKPGSVIVVESGRSLWRIARKVYGKGPRYTVIYEANKNQIKDPDLIFPGQVFKLPNIR